MEEQVTAVDGVYKDVDLLPHVGGTTIKNAAELDSDAAATLQTCL